METTLMPWAQFEALCLRLLDRLPSRAVYGLPVGGSMLAMALAHLSGKYARAPVSMLDKPEEGCVVVIDVLDRRARLTPYVRMGFAVRALICKPCGDATLDPFAEGMSGWVQFPWERPRYPANGVGRCEVCRMSYQQA